MKNFQLIKKLCVAIILAFTTLSASATNESSEYAAQVYFLDGTVRECENFTIPRGTGLTVFASKVDDLVVREFNAKGQLEDVILEAQAVEYFVCWNKANSDVKFVFKKICFSKNGKKTGWAVVERVGEQGILYGLSPKYSIDEDGTMTLQGDKAYGPADYVQFKGDEYAVSMSWTGVNWNTPLAAAYAFAGDDKMIKDIKNGKYKVEDLQYILDNYKRPQPNKIKK